MRRAHLSSPALMMFMRSKHVRWRKPRTLRHVSTMFANVGLTARLAHVRVAAFSDLTGLGEDCVEADLPCVVETRPCE